MSYYVPIEEDILIPTVGFSFKKLARGIGKAAGGVVKATAKAGKAVATSSITKAGVGVLAVAFPAVGVPAAAAIAAANVAISQVEKGKATAKQINRNLAKLVGKAKGGDTKAATAVNAMQIAIARSKAAKAGKRPPVPVAKGNKRPPVPTSLYRASTTPAALATRLAAGGSPLGKQVLAGVQAGKAVTVPGGVVVVPGRAPIRGRRVWIGRPPAGVNAQHVPGGHAVTRSGYVLSGQDLFIG